MAAHGALGLLPPVKSARGLTLVELMLTAAILSLVMLSTLSLYRSGVFAYTKYRERQEHTDQCEIVFATLAADLRGAAAVEFVEPHRISLRLPDAVDNGWTVPGQRIIYEYRPAPESHLLRVVNGEERVVARAVEEMIFVPATDGATVAVSYKGAGMSRLCCTLPVGMTFPCVRPYPNATVSGQP